MRNNKEYFKDAQTGDIVFFSEEIFKESGNMSLLNAFYNRGFRFNEQYTILRRNNDEIYLIEKIKRIVISI